MSELLTPEEVKDILGLVSIHCTAKGEDYDAAVGMQIAKEVLARAKRHYELKIKVMCRIAREQGREQLLKHRSRPELREKMAIGLCEALRAADGRQRCHPIQIQACREQDGFGKCSWCEEQSDKFLLLYPDEEAISKQLIPDGWGNVGVEYRLYPGGVECVVTYITEAGFEESKSFVDAPRDKIEHYDRQALAIEALRQALKKGA